MQSWGATRRAAVLGSVVVAVGISDVVVAAWPTAARPLTALAHTVTPLHAEIDHGSAGLLGIVLILVGRALIARRRLAFYAALGIFAACAMSAAPDSARTAAAPGVLAIAVLLSRSEFSVRVGAERLSTLTRVLAGGGAMLALYGGGGLFLHADAAPEMTLRSGAHEVAARALGFDGPLSVSGGFGDWFPASVSLLGGLTVIVIALVAFAPQSGADPASDWDRQRALGLMHRADGDSLDPFALRRDRAFVFSPDGRAAVGYRYVAGVGLAGGEPLGDPASAGAAIDAFLATCAERGWRPAFVGVREDRTDWYHPLRRVYIGDEAQVDIETFSLVGRHMRNVRQAVSRSRNFGVVVDVGFERDLDSDLRGELNELARRTGGGGINRDGFSMTLEASLDLTVPGAVVAIARDQTGRPIGFQHFVPYADDAGLSLSVMRRERGSPNGVHEAMIVAVLEWARDRGYRTVSLNFLAWRRVLQAAATGSRRHAVPAAAVRLLEPVIQAQRLHRFNAKFHPRWVPRCVVYRSPADIVAIAVAAFVAEFVVPSAAPEPSGLAPEPEPART